MPALAVAGVLAGVDEALAERLGQVFQPAEVLVVPEPLARQQSVERVMEVVVPVGVQAVAPGSLGTDEAGVVPVAFGNQVDPSTQRSACSCTAAASSSRNGWAE